MGIMNKAYLLTGGNIGDRTANLAMARDWISRETGELTAISKLYETAAWGKMDQPSFLNQALEVSTQLKPGEFLEQILEIEKKIGRVRKEKYGPRVIDIDILLFNDEVIDQPSLKLPHPELPNRRFALAPLTEIAAKLVHPILNKTIEELLFICPDKLEVTVYNPQKQG